MMRSFLFFLFSAIINIHSAVAADVPDNWMRYGILATRAFESSSIDEKIVYSKVTGDFDDAGLSLGSLQWNYGEGSIAELLAKVQNLEAVAQKRMGDELASTFLAVSKSKEIAQQEGLAFARGLQHCKTSNGRKNCVVKDDASKALKAFLLDDAVIEAQRRLIREVAQRSFNDATKWATATRKESNPRFSEFMFFFDLSVQNGGRKDATDEMAKEFIDTVTEVYPPASDEGINDTIVVATAWAAARWKFNNSTLSGRDDAIKNKDIWRKLVNQKAVDESRKKLLILTFLRSLVAKKQWMVDTFNRKGTLAMGSGWVHKDCIDMSSLYALVDKGDAPSASSKISVYCAKKRVTS